MVFTLYSVPFGLSALGVFPVFQFKIWGKTGGKLYGMVAGEDFDDNQLRFSIFCQVYVQFN